MTSGAGTAYPSGGLEFTLGLRDPCCSIFSFLCSVFVDHCLYFYFWPLYCLWKKCHKFVDMNVMYFFLSLSLVCNCTVT
jgi:hypothetical protein